MVRTTLLFFVSLTAVNAATLFSVGGSIQSTQYSLSGIEVAISFVASANETVTGAGIVGSGGTITMQIEGNSGGAPSNTPLTGGTATANLTNPSLYSAFTSLDASLVDNTEYWIVLSGNVNINSSNTAVGSVSNVNAAFGWDGSWAGISSGEGDYFPNLDLTGTNAPVPQTPEPATAGLLFGAMALLAAAARRKLSRISPV